MAVPARSLFPLALSILLLGAVTGQAASYRLPAPPAPRAASAPATKLRIYRVGDRWEWSLKGSIQGPGGKVNVTGTVVTTVEKNALDGKDVLVMSQAMAMQAAGQEASRQTSTTYFSQDPKTGNVTELADTHGPEGAIRKIKNPQVSTPGTWSSKTKMDLREEFTNGDSEHSTLSVAGREKVTTPGGSFQTWKTTETETDSDNKRVNATDWWAPEIGQIVKGSARISMPSQLTMTFELVLQSTSVKPK